MSEGRAYYSDRAELLRERARDATSESIKTAYLNIARSWEQMAETLQDAADLTLEPPG